MKKIGIIKLGAKGDVIRTLPILPALKDKHRDSMVYWITWANISDLLENNPLIDNVICTPCDIQDNLEALYNFDIDSEASNLALKIKAKNKYGFYIKDNYLSAFNLSAEYYLNTIFDDKLKKDNKKTYQEMMFELAELEYHKQPFNLYLNNKDSNYAENFIRRNNIKKGKIVGIHMGSGPRWPSKAWAENKIKELILRLNNMGYSVILFGGPDELSRFDRLIRELRTLNISIYHNDPNNTNREFASLINLCDNVVCSDSFALHISLGLQRKTIALFFCTSPNEVEGYGLLTKLISPKLHEFFPERMNEYNEELINSISVEDVFKAIINE